MGIKLKRKGLQQKDQVEVETDISPKPMTGVSVSLFRQVGNLEKGKDRTGNIKRGVGVGRGGKGKGGGRKKSRTKSVGDTQIDFLPMEDRQFVSKMDWILEDELQDGYIFKKVTLAQQKKMEGANVFIARRDLKRQMKRT